MSKLGLLRGLRNTVQWKYIMTSGAHICVGPSVVMEAQLFSWDSLKQRQVDFPVF